MQKAGNKKGREESKDEESKSKGGDVDRDRDEYLAMAGCMLRRTKEGLRFGGGMRKSRDN